MQREKNAVFTLFKTSCSTIMCVIGRYSETWWNRLDITGKKPDKTILSLTLF